jgi:beta-1,4-mannosyl-glycoprotein beta-1,4-N-acetylglucosaminyltransferase
MIVDCFSFFNELELLDIRLNVLDPHVDKFVLVEAAKTQSLKDKPFVFEDNKEKFNKFLNKIIHVKLEKEECPSGDFRQVNYDWGMENLQRDSAQKGLKRIGGMNPDDIVLISDLDEIPNLSELETNIKIIKENQVTSFTQNTFSYFLNMQCYDVHGDGEEEKVSRHSLGVSGSVLNVYSPQELWGLRNTAASHPTPRGWHFSFMGGPEKVREKSLSCIEPFDKSAVPSAKEMETIFNRRVFEEGFWNINDPHDNSVKVKKIKDESTLPEYLIGNKGKFEKLLC